jgi:opacity protein-like surface antigen
MKRSKTLGAVLAVLALGLAAGAAAAPVGPPSYWDPAWSPDGKQIAFVDHRGAGDLYVMNADGSGLRQLTQSSLPPAANYGARQPAWSPDGSRIAFGYGYTGISVIKRRWERPASARARF